MGSKIIFIALALTIATPVLAYVSASSNYQIERDSINFAGGLSSSASYGLEDTAGETGTGLLTSASYNLLAGYQQLDAGGASTLSITSPVDIDLSPDIPETGGGEASGSASWTVVTNNAAGYSLTVAAGASPALSSGSDSFADYVPSGADPDYVFIVGDNSKVFAFTAEGSHITSNFKDDGLVCGTGSGDTASTCWDGLSTTAVTVAQSASATLGTATTLRFKAAAGSDATVDPGSYTAALTLTLTAL